MPVESASYVAQLNPSNPSGSEAADLGDNHVRLVKQALVNSFPQVTGAVSATHTELSRVAGVTSAIQTQLDGKQAGSGTISRNVQDVISHTNGAYTYTQYLFTDGSAGWWDNGNSRSAWRINIPTGNANFYGTVTAGGLLYGRGGGAGLGQITVSTGDPSGGADGDVWFRVA